MHGQGTFTTVQGDVYRGTFKRDMMNGTGRFEYSDGDVYEGTSRITFGMGTVRARWRRETATLASTGTI